LHGFASRLLSEFAVAARLPPRVRVLDEVSSQLAHEDRWSRFVDALYEDPSAEELLTRAALLDVALEPRFPRHTTLRDVAVEFNQNWDRLDDLIDHEPGPLAELDFGGFDRAVDAILSVPALCTDQSDGFYVKLTEELIPPMLAIRDVADPNRKLGLLAGMTGANGFKKGSAGRAGSWDGGAKEAKKFVDEVNLAVDELITEAADEVLRHLLHDVAIEVKSAAVARRADGGLEFHDLLVLAREMLRTNGEARAQLHQRYTHILLDEFQDTDPIQIELAMLIAATVAEGAQPGPWHDLEIEAGRLFFVGDPKQSIYRFRRADIKLFLETRNRFGPGGSWARLTTNFRTVPPILDWVNALFTEFMPIEQDGKQPKYEPLVAFRKADSGADHRPLLIGGCHPDPKVKAADLREVEATDVAKVVADIIERPEAWPVHDEITKSWRPARLSDVTILLPTRTSLPFLRAALDGDGVPYRIATGTLVYDTQEVRDALAALRAIDDPTDELSLIAALRSPLYACSDVDLLTFRQLGGHWDFRRSVPDLLAEDHPVRSAYAHLETLWSQRWWSRPSSLLERLLRERQATMLAFGDARPTDVWRRLRFLVEQGRAFEEASGGDLRAFTEWAALQGADLARVHEPMLPETDEEALQILTIHGSKGLEFPITILSGMTTQHQTSRAGVSVLWGESGPPEVKLRAKVATANHEPRANLESDMDAHEKLRLAYVAATRARDHLVVSCHHKAAAADKSYGGQFWGQSAEQPVLWRSGGEAEPQQLSLLEGLDDPASPDPSPEVERPEIRLDLEAEASARANWARIRERWLSANAEPRVVSATGVAKAALLATSEAAAAAEVPDDDDDGADQPEDGTITQRRRGRAGTAIGSAVHGVLQFADFAHFASGRLDGSGRPDLDLLVRQQCAIEGIPDHVDVVAKLVGSALASEAIQLVASHAHHKELFVAAPVGNRIIEGYVDLLVEGPDGLIVVDYKTDSVSSEEDILSKLATYELQGASYAVALEEVLGVPVVDCRFVFCRSTGAIERSVVDLDGAKKRVRETLEVVES